MEEWMGIGIRACVRERPAEVEEWMGIGIRACVREAGRSGRVDGDWH